VFLRVTTIVGIGRTIKSRKLTPRFVGPYQILKRIGTVAYEIAQRISCFLVEEIRS